jgi:hypothetical protein
MQSDNLIVYFDVCFDFSNKRGQKSSVLFSQDVCVEVLDVHGFLKKVGESVGQSILCAKCCQHSHSPLNMWEGLMRFSMLPFNLLREHVWQ